MSDGATRSTCFLTERPADRVPYPGAPAEAAARSAVDSEVLERLRALGYVR